MFCVLRVKVFPQLYVNLCAFYHIQQGCIVVFDNVSIGLENAVDVALVCALSLGMPLMMLTRNLAFTMNNDTSIAMLLYLEIVLAFLWEYLLLGGGLPSLAQVIGSLLIILGSCCSVVIKDYVKKEGPRRVDSFADMFDPKRDFIIPPDQEIDRDIEDLIEGGAPRFQPDLIHNDPLLKSEKEEDNSLHRPLLEE